MKATIKKATQLLFAALSLNTCTIIKSMDSFPKQPTSPIEKLKKAIHRPRSPFNKKRRNGFTHSNSSSLSSSAPQPVSPIASWMTAEKEKPQLHGIDSIEALLLKQGFENDNPELVKEALELNVDPNSVLFKETSEEISLLNYTIQQNKIQIAALLIAYGATVSDATIKAAKLNPETTKPNTDLVEIITTIKDSTHKYSTKGTYLNIFALRGKTDAEAYWKTGKVPGEGTTTGGDIIAG